MALSMTELGQDITFERFLGATVGKDNRETDVTVMSMLARLNVDPWDEASELSKMSYAPARRRLNTLMDHFGDVPTLESEREKVISNLLDLLPKKRTP